MATPKTVAFHTLGCKLNFSETSAISRQFVEAGYGVEKFEEGADIYVINTCSVTEQADSKCRYVVRSALKKSPDAKVVIIGCYAQLKPKEISEIPGVDLVLGASEKFQVLDFVDGISKSTGKAEVHATEVHHANSFEQAFSFGDRTRSFLKVQDGCDYKCAFCTIPNARGNSRSNTIENVVKDAQKVAELGLREIVLTGVNIGDFGKQPYLAANGSTRFRRKEYFSGLITALDEQVPVERFRISSIEPNLCTEEIIQTVSRSEKFLPHFHMPLQSGSDTILKLMRRRYKTELYKDRIDFIKLLMPSCCIGVDVIVGFPGETEAHFQETFDFLESLDVSYLHVFTYSERENTAAWDMEGKVPVSERRRRNRILRELSDKKRSAFYRAHLGETRPVLFEQSKQEGMMTGYTDNYIKVVLPMDSELINLSRQVQLIEIDASGHVRGELVEVPVS
jgi:threonylcarbamoyladenosine tRNA methylthiotransferase MtaB